MWPTKPTLNSWIAWLDVFFTCFYFPGCFHFLASSEKKWLFLLNAPSRLFPAPADPQWLRAAGEQSAQQILERYRRAKRGGRLSVGADDFGGSFEDSRCDFVRLKFCSLKFKPWSYLVICCDLLRCTLQWAEQLLGRKVSSLQFVGCSGKLWRNVSSTTVWWIFSETPQLWPHKGNSTTPVTWVTGED